MVWTEVRSLGEAHQGCVAHQAADPTMQMRGGVVDVFSVFETDHVGHFGRVKYAAVPAGNSAAADIRERHRRETQLIHVFNGSVEGSFGQGTPNA